MSQKRRDQDRAAIEAELGLTEHGGPQRFELGDGRLFATAYTRIVYGDRGPYLEFEREHIAAPLRARFGDSLDRLPSAFTGGPYYVWLHPEGAPDVKVYWQIRTVAYADYRRGLYYVDPRELRAPGRPPFGQRSLFAL